MWVCGYWNGHSLQPDIEIRLPTTARKLRPNWALPPSSSDNSRRDTMCTLPRLLACFACHGGRTNNRASTLTPHAPVWSLLHHPPMAVGALRAKGRACDQIPEAKPRAVHTQGIVRVAHQPAGVVRLRFGSIVPFIAAVIVCAGA